MEKLESEELMYRITTECRSCGSKNLEKIIYFGDTALSDALLTKEMLDKPELKVPLTLAFCKDCTLVQILEEVKPEILFCRNYPYYSSVSKYLLEHFAKSANSIIQEKKLSANSLVIEAASNDGYMLKNFVEKDIPVLGIDPAEGQVKIANNKGIRSLNEFFTSELAKKLHEKDGLSADVFLANNVLAHVPDLNGFVDGIFTLLKENGTAVIEAPYLMDLIDHCEFDTIYHQHLCYFSVTALDKLFRRHNLFLNRIERVAIHGGTLRLFIEKVENPQDSVKKLLTEEADRNVTDILIYKKFAERIHSIKSSLLQMLDKIKKDGKTIVGYGAAAKANTLTGYFGIGSNYLEAIADLSKFKQGLFFSGNHLPIVPPAEISEKNYDYMLILAWNFANEIMEQQQEFKNKGGKFIIPIPEPKIV